MVIKLSITVLMFVVHCIQCAVCLNSKLTTQRGSSVLTCEYIGVRKITALLWYNGSNPRPLILRKNDSDGQWYDFAKNTSPFDMDRINYSCSPDNICTLEIKPLLPRDDNGTISCKFLDPDEGEPKANVTIHLEPKANGTIHQEGDQSSQTLSAGEIAACIIVPVVVITVAIIYWKWRMNTRKFKSGSQVEVTSPIQGDTTVLSSMEQQVSQQQQMADYGQDTNMEGVNLVWS